MVYKIEIIENFRSIVEIKAKSVVDALSKVERMYNNDKVQCGDLENVNFCAILDGNKTVCKTK